MKESFVDKTFQKSSLQLIEWCNEILEEYSDQGYQLTLRQLYYQLVARELIRNNIRSYKRLGNVVGDARLAGLIDWWHIEDRERPVHYPGHWDSPADILNAAANSFRLDRWIDQPNHVEVMVEKKALEGVLIPVCRELDVRFSANRGYSSLSAMYRAGKRLEYASEREGKTLYILYLGDHDPSGLDMDRDIEDRARMFCGYRGVALSRLALKWEQIEALNLPENPAKMTDSRAAAYVAEFGMSSWELDALEPRELARLVREAVIALRDEGKWAATMAREQEMIADLRAFAARYEEGE